MRHEGSGWDQSFFVPGRSRSRSRSGWNFFINLCSASLSSVTTVFWQTVPAAMATKTPASPFPELRRFESGEGAVITPSFFYDFSTVGSYRTFFRLIAWYDKVLLRFYLLKSSLRSQPTAQTQFEQLLSGSEAKRQCD